MRTCDLQCHSLHSDGTMTPRALVEEAARIGLDALALTDHDTVDGVPEAMAAGAELGVEVLPAVELTVDADGAKVDVLAYLIDLDHAGLNGLLDRMQRARLARFGKMIKRLNANGYALDEEDVRAHSSNHIIGRPHVAQALMEKGHARSMNDAFERIIGDGGPGYVAKQRFAAAEAIEAVHAAGGVAVLAHPILVGPWVDQVLDHLVAAGLDGIEAYYPIHKPWAIKRYEKLAREHDLVVTGGSDFHGSNKSDRRLGGVVDGRPVPYALVERLKERAGRA